MSMTNKEILKEFTDEIIFIGKLEDGFRGTGEDAVDWLDVILLVKDREKEQAITTAKREALRQVAEIVEDKCVWYNANNQIPDTEIGKEDEHWQMLRKIVKDSLSEVNGSIQEAITHLESELTNN